MESLSEFETGNEPKNVMVVESLQHVLASSLKTFENRVDTMNQAQQQFLDLHAKHMEEKVEKMKMQTLMVRSYHLIFIIPNQSSCVYITIYRLFNSLHDSVFDSFYFLYRMSLEN